MKTILVTGAGGFLGKYLIDSLIEQKEFVIYAFDLTKELLVERFPENKSICFFDFADWADGKIPFKDADIFVHCAFSRTNTGPHLAKSLIFSQQLFAQSIDNSCHLINISSRSVYGQNPNIPWNENTLPEPDNMYAIAKLSSELLLNSVSRQSKNTNNCNIRLAGLIGIELDSRIVNKFIKQAINRETINIKGGCQQFAFLDVRDAAAGIIALLKLPAEAWKPVYNLGYLRSYSIIEIADAVAKVAREFNLPEVMITLEQTEDTLYAEMDSGLFYKDTGWRPCYDMLEVVRSIFTHQLQHK
jgi:nucleoside-diphosphate-sugar epimerase